MDKDFAKIESSVSAWFSRHQIVNKGGGVKLSQLMFNKREVLAILKVLLLSNGWIAQGPKVAQFEKLFARYIGTKEAVAVNSGTSANMIALDALKRYLKMKDGDEVIVPAATFPSVVSPVVQLGLTPVFVDVDPDGNICADAIKKALSKRTKLVIVVHTMGKPADVIKIHRVLKSKGIPFMEDTCESHGAMIGKHKAGSFGILSTFSFYVAHNMTTGEGGMVLTNNQDLALIMQSLRDFGRFKGKGSDNRFGVSDPVLGNYDTRYLFTHIGYNLRMSDLEAVVGIEQLSKLDWMNQKRVKCAEYYTNAFASYKNYFDLPQTDKGTFHSYYGYMMSIKESAPFSRDELVAFLERNNIETRPLFGGCLPDQPAFREVNKKVVGKLVNARAMRDRAFFIATHPGLTKSDMATVTATFKRFLAKYK